MQVSTQTSCFENECCRIDLDTGANCLVLNWKGLVPSGPFREIYEQTLLLLRRHKLSRLLSNARHMKTIGSTDLRWLETHWIPAARQAGLSYAALVESDNIFNQMTVSSFLEKVGSCPVKFQQFSSEGAARYWLMSR